MSVAQIQNELSDEYKRDVASSWSESEKYLYAYRQYISELKYYVKSLDGKNITIISVAYETKGKNGQFINKQILINDKIIESAQDIRKEIYHTCMIKDDCVSIMAITEYNDPKNFSKIINN